MTKLAEFIKKQNIMAYVAMGIVVFSLTYFLFISFIEVKPENKEFVSRCLDYVYSSLAMVIGYYFGASHKKETEAK